MSNRNYTQKVRTTLGYDTLYPKTTAAQVITDANNRFVSETEKEAIRKVDALWEIRNVLSSRNLLINWDFQNLINQRGLMEYRGAIYGLDRWYGESSSIVKIVDGGIEISSPLNSNTIAQKIENPRTYIGKKYTLSVKINDVIYSATMSDDLQMKWAYHVVIDNPLFKAFLYTPPTLNDLVFYINVTTSTPVVVQAAKLEVGTISTLANDAPQDYGVELAKCQRYYEVIPSVKFTMPVAGTYYRIPALYTVAKRITPTVTVQSPSGGIGKIWMYYVNGSANPSGFDAGVESNIHMAVINTPSITTIDNLGASPFAVFSVIADAEIY